MTQWTFQEKYKIFFSDKQDGNMSLKDGYNKKEALRNRRTLFSFLESDLENAVFPVQTHSDHIVCVGKKERGRGVYTEINGIQDCDALFSKNANIPLGIQVADCVPVVLWDEQKSFIMIIHAGWKGLAKRIVSKAVLFMKKEGSEVSDIGVWIGPSAGPCCFEVGDEVRRYFPRQKKEERLNLWKEATDQLVSKGISEEKIAIIGDCTICNPRYFSYRREGKDAGRMIAGVVRVK